MKLLLLDQFSDPGGAQQGLLDLLPAIRERGWDATVGLPGTGTMFDRVREAGFAVERIECGPYSSGRKSLGDVARFLAGTQGLARQISTMAAGTDLVYINGPRLLPAVAMAGLQPPVVFHSHSLVGPGMMRRIAGRALRRTDASVVANCELVAATWRGYVDRVSVIFNGVGDVRALARHATPRGCPTVGCIGRIAREKGQLEFLEAAEQIHQELPGARFIIYGTPLFGEVAAESYDLQVRTRAARLPVVFAGWVKDVDVALSNIDVLLVPSAAHEATTRVILEAYAAGVPVIAFASGGIPEIVEDGVTGFLTRSAAEMASKTIELLSNPPRRTSIATAARECWRRRFTLERYQHDVLAALETAQRRGAQDLRLRPMQGHIRAG
jgi:glycosyltransferase involved in cell wall biosynthesis